MFRAVRTWWGRPRHQRTVRLFFFELTVVMIGVLAAQQVSSWAQRRTQNQTIDDTYDNLTAYSRVYVQIARTYATAIPCLDGRVGEIMRTAATAAPADPSTLPSIPLIGVSPDNVSVQDFRDLAGRYGNRKADIISTIQFNLKQAEAANQALEDDWATFRRLDPALGPVGQADRGAVRAAGVDAMAKLRRLSDVARIIQVAGAQLGLKPNPRSSFGPIASCAVMWRTGRSYSGGL